MLGALLFLIYINDMDSDIVNELLKFADDTYLDELKMSLIGIDYRKILI